MVNKYYKKHKEKFRKEARERYQNVFAEEKEKMWKKIPRLSKSFWRKKRKESWVYEKSFFST